MQVSFPSPNRRFGTLDALGIFGFVGFFVARFIPVAKLIPFWGCAFRQYTGYPCPGCGLTRVADRFAHFHFLGAFKANPLGTIGAAAFAVMTVWMLLHLLFKVPTPDVELTDKEWRLARNVVVVAVVINYVFVVINHRAQLWV